MTDNEAFTVWYQAYPKKKAKGDAIKAWGTTKKDRLPIEQMLEILTAQCHSDDWRKDDGKFIPYPATYLRRLQFLDELEVTLPQIQNSWKETWPGIVKKGRELGLTEDMFDQPYMFKEAVLKKAEKQEAAVFRLRSA
jgi:hypothetical protein